MEFGNVLLSKTAVELLNKLRSKAITLEEFLRKCAYWAIRSGFDELMPLSLPTAPTTQAFVEYESLPPERKLKLDIDFFYKNPEINEYYRQVNMIAQRNKKILEWLKEIRDYLPKIEKIYLRKIDERIIEFQGWFDDNPVIVEKIKNIFEVKEAQDEAGRN